MAVVINDFEVVPQSASEPSPPVQDVKDSSSGGGDVDQRIAIWLAKQRERSLRNWAH